MKRTIHFLLKMISSLFELLRQSSKTFITKTEEERLDHHTISISTR